MENNPHIYSRVWFSLRRFFNQKSNIALTGWHIVSQHQEDYFHAVS